MKSKKGLDDLQQTFSWPHIPVQPVFDLFDQKQKKMDLRGLMEEIKTELTLQDRVGTAMSYQCAVDSAYKFAGVRNLMLTDIDAQWLREYEKYNLAKGNRCNV